MSTTEQQARYEENNIDASKSALSILVPAILGLSIAAIILHGFLILLTLEIQLSSD